MASHKQRSTGPPTACRRNMLLEWVRAGHQASVDNLSTFPWRDIEQLLRARPADLYGISCLTINRRGVMSLASPHDFFSSHIVITSRGCPGECTFCNGPSMWKRKRGLRIVWSCDTRADALDEELLCAMRRAGCRMLSLGVESGSPEIGTGPSSTPGRPSRWPTRFRDWR